MVECAAATNQESPVVGCWIMETPEEFSARAMTLLQEAISVSKDRCGDRSVLNHWMSVAKRQRMTWVDGLAFSIEKMRTAVN